MSAQKIAEPPRLRRRLHRTGDDSLKVVSGLNFQRAHHRVRSFANGNHQHPVVGMKVVEIFADPQNAAFTANMAFESPINARLAERAFKNLPRRNPHLDGSSLAVGRRHGKDYRSEQLFSAPSAAFFSSLCGKSS
jgi:hypothetical protein